MSNTNPKTILITGASRGIGLLTAKTLAKRGHHVYAGMRDLNERNAEAAADLRNFAEQSSLSLRAANLDVASPDECARAVADIEQERPIDVLINNAGVMPVGATEAFSIDQLKALFDVNMFGLASMSQAVLPAMRKRQNGLLIHISSAAGRLAIPYFGAYCASKWAMEAYAETLNYELAPFNIQSVLVEPSGHATDLVHSAPTPERADILKQYGPLAEGREKLLGMFLDLFAQGHAGNDAQNVADSIAQLIEMEGPRPLRTQVGDDMGVTAINEAVAPIQASLIAQLTQVYAPTDTSPAL